MKQNITKNERTLRIIAGAVILGLGVYFKSNWGWVGLIPLLTGLFGYCPLYSVCTMNCKK